MIKAPIYTVKGTKTGELTLPKDLFEIKPNLNLLAQAVHVYQERGHTGLRKTQTRSEVNRTTKKLYKQKGTGGARHGSRRANLFVGGGVALGPRPIKRILTVPDKLKTSAKLVAYSLKAKDGQIIVVSGMSKIARTKTASELVKALSTETKAKKFTFILSDGAKEIVKFLRNLSNVRVISYKDANVYDVFTGSMIVMDEGIFGDKVKQVVKVSQVSKAKTKATK